MPPTSTPSLRLSWRHESLCVECYTELDAGACVSTIRTRLLWSSLCVCVKSQSTVHSTPERRGVSLVCDVAVLSAHHHRGRDRLPTRTNLGTGPTRSSIAPIPMETCQERDEFVPVPPYDDRSQTPTSIHTEQRGVKTPLRWQRLPSWRPRRPLVPKQW